MQNGNTDSTLPFFETVSLLFWAIHGLPRSIFTLITFVFDRQSYRKRLNIAISAEPPFYTFVWACNSGNCFQQMVSRGERGI